MSCNCKKCLNPSITIICRNCGSKECPHARDCDLACTLAEWPAGSVYG
jgi:hypothetical protein